MNSSFSMDNGRPTVSLLTSCMESSSSQTLPRAPQTDLVNPGRIEHQQFASWNGDENCRGEPPLTLNEEPCHSVTSDTSQPVMISPSQSPSSSNTMIPQDLSFTPLTACSYNTMQQHYDRDTWRMYERIQSSRCESLSKHQHPEIQRSLPFVNEGELYYNNEMEDGGSEDGIFDLDF